VQIDIPFSIFFWSLVITLVF